jgi:hypothetical protein
VIPHAHEAERGAASRGERIARQPHALVAARKRPVHGRSDPREEEHEEKREADAIAGDGQHGAKRADDEH